MKPEALPEIQTYTENFNKKNADFEYYELTSQEYADAYLDGLLTILTSKLSDLHYGDPEQVELPFEKGEDGALVLRLSRDGEQCALSLLRGAPSVVPVPWRPDKRFAGFWTAQNGLPALSLRSSADPDTLEGTFRLEGKELRFEGFCTGFPFGRDIFREE